MSKARELANLGNAYSDGALSNRNMVINGKMSISQRYGTASTSVHGSSVFAVDRFNCFGPTSGSTSTAQQVTDSPFGFSNSLKYTCGTGLAVTGGDYAQILHIIEGNNIAHLGWGSADAANVTVSFWVKSSLTGTFSFGVQNSNGSRSYVAQYSIVTANTWEYKTITISGDTSGVWASDNTAGMRLTWDMGFGYGATSTVDAWQAGDVHYVSGNVKVNENSGATFYLTGVQCEIGDTATPFEHRSYGDELARCQRYYQRIGNNDGSNTHLMVGGVEGASIHVVSRALATVMRANPSATLGDAVRAYSAASLVQTVSSFSTRSSRDIACLSCTVTGTSTTGQSAVLYGADAINSTGRYIELDAEL